jgi:hypothetical protein
MWAAGIRQPPSQAFARVDAGGETDSPEISLLLPALSHSIGAEISRDSA